MVSDSNPTSRSQIEEYWQTNAELFASFYNSTQRVLLGTLVNRFLKVRFQTIGELILSRLHTGQRVIDVGCGDGPYMALAAMSGTHVIGVDYSRQMLHLNRERMTALAMPVQGVVQSDAMALPLPASTFDWLFAVGLLDYVPDLGKTLHEMARVVRPGGWAVATIPRRPSPFAISRAPIIAGLRRTLLGLPPLYNIHTREEFQAALETHGFEVEHLSHVQRTMWVAIARSTKLFAQEITEKGSQK